MAELLSPGIFITEVSSSVRSIRGVSTSTVGFVGLAEKGPIGVPTYIGSEAEFTRIFGKLQSYSFLGYAIQAFFRNGGLRCYVVRTAHYTDIQDAATLTAVKSSLNLQGAALGVNVTLGATSLKVDAINEGTWGDQLNVTTQKVKTLVNGTVSSATAQKVIVDDVAGFEVGDICYIKGATKLHRVLVTAINVGADELYFKAQDFSTHNIEDNSEIWTPSVHKVTTTLKAGTTLLTGATSAELTSSASVVVGSVLSILDTRQGVGEPNYVNVVVNQVTGNTVYFDAITLSASILAANSKVVSQQFNLTVSIGTELKEKFTYLSMKNEDLTDYVEAKINGKSTYITVTELTDPIPATAETNTFTFTGLTGNDFDVVGAGLKFNLAGSLGYVWFRVTDGANFPQTDPGGTGTGVMVDVLDADNATALATKAQAALALAAIVGVASSSALAGVLTVNYLATLGNVADGSAGTSGVVFATAPQGVDAIPAGDDVSGIPHGKEVRAVLTGGSNGLTGLADIDYIGDPSTLTGIYAFDLIEDIPLVAVPGITTVAVHNGLITYCEGRKDTFAVIDSPEAYTSTQIVDYVKNVANFNTSFAAIYWPWVLISDPITGLSLSRPPAGFVLGRYAYTDNNRQAGVAKAPAGISDGQLQGVIGLETSTTQADRDLVYPNKINPLADFPGDGRVIWGAQTLSSDSNFRLVQVRRLFIYIRSSLMRGMRFVVFENNDATTRAAVRRTIGAFLLSLWRRGMLQGAKPEDAFFITCDESNNPPSVIDQGRLVCDVGVAPQKAAEFFEINLAIDQRALQEELAAAGL